MSSTVGVAVLTLIGVYAVKYFKKYFWDLRHLNGPSPFLSLPIFGHAWMIGDDIPRYMDQCAEKYGPIFRFDMGYLPTVIIGRYDDYVDAYKLEPMNGRAWSIMPFVRNLFGTDSKGEVFGVGSSNGPVWAEQRKFMHINLNRVGMGKAKELEEIVEQEVEVMCERVAKLSEVGGVDFQKLLPVAINNVIWRMITGKTSKQDDPFMVELTDCMNRHFETLSPSNPISTLQQYFHRCTKVATDLGIIKGFKDILKLRDTVAEQISELQPESEGNFVERFLFEIESANPESSFYGKDGRRHLFGNAVDLFIAGTETTATFMTWTFKFLIMYPEVQEKISNELCHVFGSAKPSLDRRDELPYTHATIQETIRLNPLGVFSVARLTLSPINLKGTPIPKHTQILPYLRTINRDPKSFPDPNEFRPERFLDQDGKFVFDERVTLFGKGKRKCVGEVLAKAEIFLFLTHMVHNFRIKPAPGQIYTLKSNPGLAFTSDPYQAVVESR
uniref:Cytochrome P450 CYP3028A1 n=1 Tax=Tigriopus kingsejongensis TaxID=1133412 RepID=A0A2H4FY67_9MAXI|nr:cytochrome P450 CYP3028A1 [Tigriopus kingsejongensis]